MTEAELETALAGLSFPECDAPVVSLLVPVFNNLRLTAECLFSIRRHTDGTIPYEVILVDDASTDRTQGLLSRVPGLVYRRNDTNLHFLRSCNAGADAARGEFLLLLNNDVQVTAGWLAPPAGHLPRRAALRRRRPADPLPERPPAGGRGTDRAGRDDDHARPER